MKCPECDYENREGAKFCLECGAKLEDVCPQCGAKLPPEARFCDECGAKLAGTTAPPTEVAVPKLEDMHAQLQSLMPDTRMSEQATGENRPVTALFADISGFTPMSNTQSSETMFQLVQDCFRKLVGIVDEYEGSISGFRGDAILALFGAPILHENDAERAILAALDMREIMHQQELEVSIGINTAMMTVGEIQTQLHNEYTAYGTDINLAKRLQEAAEPGQVLVGTGTHRLTRRMFDFQILHDLSVKGFTQTVTAYSVQQVKAHPEKLRGIEGLRARMIGREHEFADLKDAADAWLNGQGQMVSIIGEAGIGKSRLVSELREYLADRTDAGKMPALPGCFEGRCVSIGQPISYWPFLDILRTYLGLGEDDDESTRARKVTESISELMPQGADEALPLLGNLLSIKFGSDLDDRLKFAGPEQIRHQTLMRLRDIFRTLAEKQPLLLILEDLHWSDDLSLDLVSLLMDELANTPLMLLCVYRPEREHRVWQLGDQARRKCLDRYTEITLQPLSSTQSRQMMESRLAIENLPESIKDTILSKSEGNPFFIEEVIRSLIEQDMIYHEDDRWKARDEIAHVSVPDTIQSIVLARVDRLRSEAKYVLQCASVIGRLFRYRLLEYLNQQERNLEQYVGEFEERELIYEERTVPELEYAFKHALTRDATYQSILERHRKEFHHQVAVGIERIYHERLEEYYEELAHHYSLSDDAEKAVEYLLKAGEKAKQNYLNDTSISYYKQVLDILEQHSIQNDKWKLEALKGMGEVYFVAGKMDESIQILQEAISLAENISLAPRQIIILYHWLTEALFWKSQYDEVIRYGEKGLELLGDDTECMEAALMNTCIAYSSRWKGDSKRHEEYIHRNMRFVKKLEYSKELRIVYDHIAQYLLFSIKDAETSLKWIMELEKQAREKNDIRGIATALLGYGDVSHRKGDSYGALSYCDAAIKMSQSIGDNTGSLQCYDLKSSPLITLGNIDEAKMALGASLEIVEQIGQVPAVVFYHRQLGIISMCQHDWDEAISHYQKSLKSDGKSIKSYFTLGRVYLKTCDYHQAIQFFEKAGGINALGGMEEAYMALGTPEKFIGFCSSSDKWQHDKRRLYLEPAEPSSDFPHLNFSDDSATKTIDPSWNWLDEFGDCAYRIIDTGELEICAANGRDIYNLNLSAPRLMREISGDFATEVHISPASEEKPQMGGLLVWRNRDNFLRFEKGIHGKHEMRLAGYVDGNQQLGGRGLLLSDDVHLRLERSGGEFAAYCSVDGEDWLTCGSMTLPMDDPIQVGIHTIGTIDRTIYCGAYKEGTATLFRGFKLWSR